MFRRLVRARLSRSLRFALRQAALELRVQRLHRASCRDARRLERGGDPLRLNLASGHHPKPGWINVDLFAPAADLRLDLREPLPFSDNAVAYIYAEHFFEHLEYPNVFTSLGWDLETPESPSEALGFLRECRRVLMPGGVLDVVVPDAEGMIGEYVGRHQVEFPMHPWWGPKWCDTPMHCVNYLFRQGREHKYAYDEETLVRVLESTGFVQVTRRAFDPTRDAPNHDVGSLCVTASKPSDGQRPPHAGDPRFGSQAP
jgi:predicted SAM-dependent methyltransferase